MRIATRRAAAGLLAVVMAAALAACGSDGVAEPGEEPIDAAKLVVYSGRNETLVGPLLDRFAAETGVATSVRYGNTAQLAAQLLEEGDRSAADVFFAQDAGALGALAKRDRLAAIHPAALQRVPQRFRSREGEWVGVSGRSRVAVYDTRTVRAEELPTRLEDLTGPRWRGRVGLAPSNASFEAAVTAMRVLQGEDAAREWLEAMKRNDVKTYNNNIQVLDAVENGQLQIGLINHYYWFERAAEKGAAALRSKLHFLPGGPGALVNVAGVGVLRTTDRREQADRLVDYLLTDEAQRYFAEETKEYPLVAGVPVAAGLPALADLRAPDIDLSDLDTLDETLRMIEEAGLT